MKLFAHEGSGRFSVPRILLMVFGGLILAATLALLFGWLVLLLWNWLMPAIFKLPPIDYWQAWGLVVLSHLLIKPSFGPGHRPGWRGRREWRRGFEPRPENRPDEPIVDK